MTTTATAPQLPEIASRLHNGAWVLAVKKGIGGWAIVLGAHLGAGAAMPFCIWKLDLDDGNAYWGDYCRTIEEALSAFERRS